MVISNHMKNKQTSKKFSLAKQLLNWFATPIEKGIIVPEGKTLVNVADQDLASAVLVLSILINLFFFAGWLLISVDDTSRAQMISLLIG